MKYFQELSRKLSLAFKRFPITILWVAFGSIHFMFAIANNNLFEATFRLDLVLILGISWFIGIQFFIEQFPKKQHLQWLKIIVLALLALFYLSLPNSSDANNISYIRFALYLLAGHIFIFFAPFIKSWNNTAYWNYLKNIIIAIGRSALFAGVLYLGLILAYAAIIQLFDIEGYDKIPGYLFVICLGLVNTCVYLADFPKDIQENKILVFNKPIAVFVKYILIPLVILYFLILYTYGFKIVLSWTLPNGWIATLVTVLAIVGFVIQIIINPFKNDSPSALIRKFHPWFYILLMPLLALLFIAVFRRISDYGFTEERYFLMISSFWILGTSLYLLSGTKRQMRILPISLFVLIIGSSFGSWSAFSISIRDQVNEFKKTFAKVNPKTKILDADNTARLRSIISYLAQRNQLNQLKPIIGFNPQKAFPKTAYYTMSNRVLDSLNIIETNSKILEKRSFSFYHYNDEVTANIDGYTRFVNLYSSSPNSQDSSGIQLIADNGNLTIEKNGKPILNLNLDSAIMQQLKKNYKLDEDNFRFTYKNKFGHFKIVFTNFRVSIRKHKPYINSASAYLFMRLN